MAGSALEVFTDFMVATGPAFLRGPEDIVNDAVKSTYTLARFIYGKSMQDMVQGGNSIKDDIFLEKDSTAKNYKPNASFTYRNPQTLTQWSIPWRFTTAHMVWTDQEIALNTGDLSRGARFHRYKMLKRSKEQNTYTSLMGFVDDQFWASPDVVEMEAGDGQTPYSLPCFITENGNSSVIGEGTVPLDGADATGWTTIQGIDPSAQTGWRNVAGLYGGFGTPSAKTDLSGASVSNAFPHIFRAMSNVWFKTRFDRLPKYPGLSDKTTVPNFIGCSINGCAAYEESLRENQDTFVTTGRQDPAFSGPQFRGIELVYIQDLDDGLLFPGTNGDLKSEATATKTGPRYWGINGKYMLKVIHRERYFYKKRPFSPSQQPFTMIQVVDLWHNNPCRSRKRHWILAPGASL